MAELIKNKEIVSILKIDNKGWNPEIFVNEIGLLCEKCHLVCCDAVELACDVGHKDDEICTFCNQCLRQLIAENNENCPISGHSDPIIYSVRSIRRKIYKSLVMCPFSIEYNQKIDKNKNEQIIDTFNLFHDEKEGIPTSNGCKYKGNLQELIDSHLMKCMQQYNPSFTYILKIEKLENENKKLNQYKQNAEKTISDISDKALRLQLELELMQMKIEKLELEKKISAGFVKKKHKGQDDYKKATDNDNNNTKKQKDGEKCAVCKKKTDLFKCSKCKCVWYCSSKHQEEDWPIHQTICSPTENNISFDTKLYNHDSYNLSKNNKIITQIPDRCYCSAYLSNRIEHGIFTWKFKIVKQFSTGWYSTSSEIKIGVSKLFKKNDGRYYLSGTSYGINFNRGELVKNNSKGNGIPGAYGAVSGDTIEMTLNLIERTIRYKINNKCSGNAFENIENACYRAIVSTSRSEDCIEILS